MKANSEWTVIYDAPNYEVNDKGVVRHRSSKRPIRHINDSAVFPEPYVRLIVKGKVIHRSVHVLTRQAQINRR